MCESNPIAQRVWDDTYILGDFVTLVLAGYQALGCDGSSPADRNVMAVVQLTELSTISGVRKDDYGQTLVCHATPLTLVVLCAWHVVSDVSCVSSPPENAPWSTTVDFHVFLKFFWFSRPCSDGAYKCLMPAYNLYYPTCQRLSQSRRPPANPLANISLSSRTMSLWRLFWKNSASRRLPTSGTRRNTVLRVWGVRTEFWPP